MLMNIDSSRFDAMKKTRIEYYNRLALNILNKQKVKNKEKVLKDEYIKSSDAVVFSKELIDIDAPFISEELLQEMNSEGRAVAYDDTFVEYKGYRFRKSQIPNIDTSKLKTITAKNNVLDFGKNNYFKYVSSDGKECNLFSGMKSIGTLMSESVKGVTANLDAERYASFWRYMMSKDPVYLDLSFSNEDIKNYLSEAGLEPGFITIKMGNKVATQYFSQGKNQGIIHSKERYDIDYNGLVSPSGYLKNFEPGAIVKIGGVEYTINEKYCIDIPYGVDVFDIEYPKVNW